ncbi:hypothetical protein [Mangrovicoccus ximenensis]|uniref:hypothetical protein n=1 Tax=Mangrovicoccus ximenensis TaxID=1911570 RepID=UPI000D3BDBA0|nr:hypothetical protein [Mangrovicoccus ximenensis]
MIRKAYPTAPRLGIYLAAMLGALNDNLIKAALVVFAAMTVPAEQAATLGLAAGGLLMLPYVLFSGLAGALADRIEKARMIRWTKHSECLLAALATAAMAAQNIPAILALVFLMGTQSAFFGPLKLGWLPERLRPEELVGANGRLEAVTFLGILAGTVCGGLLGGPDRLVLAGVAATAGSKRDGPGSTLSAAFSTRWPTGERTERTFANVAWQGIACQTCSQLFIRSAAFGNWNPKSSTARRETS